MNECAIPQDPSQKARTKIIATVGPSSDDPAQLAALIQAGVNVFRLNMAHGQPDQQQVVVDRIRKLSA